MRQFAVIGLGRFGYKVATSLIEEGAEVLAIDSNADVIQRAKDEVTQALQLDATDEDALRACGIMGVDVVVVSIGDDIQSSILATALVKKIGTAEIVARAETELHGRILKLVGATRVIHPEEDVAVRLAKSIVAPNVLEHIELAENHALVEVEANKKFIGKTLRQLDLRRRFGVNVIAIKKRLTHITPSGEEVTEVVIEDIPKSQDCIEEGDTLVVIGSNADIDDLKRLEA